VHLFNLGSTTQIGEDSVTISADVHVGALREAIIAKWKNSKLKDRDADELVVKPTPWRSSHALDDKALRGEFSPQRRWLPPCLRGRAW